MDSLAPNTLYITPLAGCGLSRDDRHRYRRPSRCDDVRDNVSAYDACYVATAATVDAMLLTADGPLSRAPNLPVSVHNVRAS